MSAHYEISESDLKSILDVVVAFSREKDYFELLNIILDEMMRMSNADAGTLYIADEGRLHFRILRNNSLNTYQGARDKIDLPPIVLDESNIKTVSAYAALKEEIVIVDDVYSDKIFNFDGPKNYDRITGYKTRSMLVFPLSTSSHEVVGVIQLINAMDKNTNQPTSFNNTCDITLLTALASISANALDNIFLAKEIDELFQSFVSVMTKAIDERSVYNVNHTKNVARFCGLFADFLAENFQEGHEFHFSKNRREQLVMAAFLHDIGKIITPLHIMDKIDRLGERLEIVRLKFEIKRQQALNKHLKNRTSPEDELSELRKNLEFIESTNSAGFLADEQIEEIKALGRIRYYDSDENEIPLLTADEMDALLIKKGTLTAKEREIMQEHVSITGRLLDNMKFNRHYSNVAAWAKGHHEYLDGSGYPQGLKGGEVTTEMCILAIIDIFDALTAMDRPYKKGMPVEKAQNILLSMAEEGKLQPELVGLFIKSGVWEALS
ncbi:MAG: HD domain-containing protein [Clostridiales bacterium]|nr:HD domain-containing protein [Clostridiales bacterium]